MIHGTEVTWITPRFGFTRFGRVIEPREDGMVRVDLGCFANTDTEIRDVPAGELREGWSR